MHVTYTCSWLCPVVLWTKELPGLGKRARPFPFPYVQLIQTFMLANTLLTPVFVAAYQQTAVWAALISALAVGGMAAGLLPRVPARERLSVRGL